MVQTRSQTKLQQKCVNKKTVNYIQYVKAKEELAFKDLSHLDPTRIKRMAQLFSSFEPNETLEQTMDTITKCIDQNRCTKEETYPMYYMGFYVANAEAKEKVIKFQNDVMEHSQSKSIEEKKQGELIGRLSLSDDQMGSIVIHEMNNEAMWKLYESNPTTKETFIVSWVEYVSRLMIIYMNRIIRQVSSAKSLTDRVNKAKQIYQMNIVCDRLIRSKDISEFANQKYLYTMLKKAFDLTVYDGLPVGTFVLGHFRPELVTNDCYPIRYQLGVASNILKLGELAMDPFWAPYVAKYAQYC